MKKVKSIHEDQYIILDNTTKHLLDLGFKYDSDEDKYTYNFSALKYEKRLFFAA